MSARDDTIHSYEVREIIARFDCAETFETAIETLVDHGIRRDAIHMIASYDSVRKKLGHLYRTKSDIQEDQSLPQPIFTDREDVASEKALAVGVPTYSGGIGTGLAVVASGGTLAFAALVAAAGAAVGAGIGGLLEHVIGTHHARELEDHLRMGALLLTIEVETTARESQVIDLLKQAGRHDVHAHSLTRYAVFDETPIEHFDPYADFGPYK